MIWFSYTDIKMMGYLQEIDLNLHQQHFSFKRKRKQWKWHDILLFQLFGLPVFLAHVYCSFACCCNCFADWGHSKISPMPLCLLRTKHAALHRVNSRGFNLEIVRKKTLNLYKLLSVDYWKDSRQIFKNYPLTQCTYMTNSTLVSLVKMEYGWNFRISGLKWWWKVV